MQLIVGFVTPVAKFPERIADPFGLQLNVARAGLIRVDQLVYKGLMRSTFEADIVPRNGKTRVPFCASVIGAIVGSADDCATRDFIPVRRDGLGKDDEILGIDRHLGRCTKEA
ncbi:hypothetical protein D3C72_2089320 [compost metagenome]